MTMEKEFAENRLATLYSLLKSEVNSDGFWSGKLSSSALSTATAIVALKINDNIADEPLVRSGYNWLCSNINSDGGFGDTPGSESNVSTSLLCYAALFYCQNEDDGRSTMKEIEKFLSSQKISLNSLDITASILKFYGNDYTFSVPILSMLTLCGVLSDEAFKRIPKLPFELSLLPASLYKFFNLQVVSYALPALIGVGIYLNSNISSKYSILRTYRNRAVGPAIRKLTSIMPESGGFLEAIPLTAFVIMCLIASSKSDNEVVKKGIKFLHKQQRSDGSWPIDTDLSTWVTTLSIKAAGADLESIVGGEGVNMLRTHLLDIQYKTRHPFNGAKPGGWGWTNFAGSVPDADDTPGAILALLEMYKGTEAETNAVTNGCVWLEELQNSDGGFPTFCRGWGRLPFDSSCADLTGHSILAFVKAIDILGDKIPVNLQTRFSNSISKASSYLQKQQSENGYWLPLWFGNQYTSDKKNPVYGTAKVCIYLEDCLLNNTLDIKVRTRLEIMTASAKQFLLSQQNTDGSWGGSKGIIGTTEETALAISALSKSNREVCLEGLDWLSNEYDINNLKANPIGLYFAALWYDEKMYPLVYYIEALRRFVDR